MKQSQLFTKTQKNAPKDEMSLNAQLLIRGGFVDKLMAGAYTILPLGWRVMKKIENIIREEIDAIGGQEIFMPALQPKENWERTGRWSTMDDLYKVKDSSDREFALGATHEEVISPLVKKFINSYKDLPFSAYQIQSKFRMELRAKSGILRGREFMMKDLYSFHLDQEDLNNYYEKAKKAYKNIFERVGIGDKTFVTFASGGSFSKYSHEFQTLTEAGEDIIYICNKCNLAINKEIKSETPQCPDCQGSDFREEKAVEVGNIFKLGTKYSAPFNLAVDNKQGEKVTLIMGCYGIGLQRLMGTIVEVDNDEKGIIWPESIAPFKVHLVSLGKNEEAEKIYQDLLKKNIEVLYDDRDVSAGEKFADTDLIGLPYRVVVSEKSLKSGGAEIKKRPEPKGEIIPTDKIAAELSK
ncbi:MAG: aminoacyl--tRNA ligase-related protein [Candidatus Moranbacteria bacterium]|nr:aminoacyl--tRNA ligase-related protein [Candidatus Moranbacteria bacterium]